MSRPGWIIVAAVILGACAERFMPAPLPAGALPYGPPPAYARWWAAVEQCAGVTAPFERVRWFVVPNGQALIADGQRDDGLWIEHYRYIVLAEGSVSDSLLVGHEMLHDLLGRVDHPPAFFYDACRGVVRP